MKITVTRTLSGVTTTEVKSFAKDKEAETYLVNLQKEKMQALYSQKFPGEKYTSDAAITKPYYIGRTLNGKGQRLLGLECEKLSIQIEHV